MTQTLEKMKPPQCLPNQPSGFSIGLYLVLPVLCLVVFFVLPLIMALVISFQDYSQNLYEPVWHGWSNYSILFSSSRFWHVIQNSIVLMLVVVPLMVILPLPLAILLNKPIVGIRFFRISLYIPVIVSVVVAGIIWKWLYMSDGLLNYLLSLLNFKPIGWLTLPQVALCAIAIMIVWKGLGYYMMMYLSSLQSVSTELYEAAEVDGANVLQKHWAVTIPHLKPTMAMVAIVSTIGALKIFPEVYVMTRGGPIGSTETFVYYIYDQAFGQLNLGLASAAGFVLTCLIFCLSLWHIRTFYLKAEMEAKDV